MSSRSWVPLRALWVGLGVWGAGAEGADVVCNAAPAYWPGALA